MKTPLGSPADSAGELYVRTDISPDQIFHAIGRLRKDARDEIDRLIRFLDATDNHMEREPDDDEPEETEPSLGSLDRAADQTRWGAGCKDDTEHEHDGGEPDDTGVGDHDGLLEQTGWQDWQHTVMA
ncbi:hypothetical protein IVB45_18535 [Bradyrhizobium sp. 4]|uniref:hypothetical protein n=1 Tax=unclassified Bradyrhizobium TaxID=2631580 RepID=UPI001FF7A0FE|nr:MULTISPECIES: hypothetical protein [unclassified Bradyrhizobium]MCK1400120.1 hypothetical protein [Bradyrhizobium sp. 39]MCK1750410.1 hypothetical protein [Bradyrhizobium sp. 135]UPJ32019.1 hypothetical protein IVB45_18535 [Bradyrhizobium sp. 4]